jgi:UDP-N-acetylmuramoyl-tripeptide--D-alanyl-D-alanine ligase
MSYKPPLHKKIFHATREQLASLWIKTINPIQIGVTGSQGKTSTTTLIYNLLKSKNKTVMTDLNLDTIYNVPITALKVKPSTKFVVFELGVDMPHQMDKALSVANPKIGVVTSISAVHTDNEHFGSIENLIHEKGKLISALPEDGIAVLNWDDENVRNMSKLSKANIKYFGTNSKKCDVSFENLKITKNGTEFTLLPKESKPFSINTKLYGTHHVQNIMAAYLAIKSLNISNDEFKNTVESIQPLKGRMSLESGPRDTYILNDALRASPKSTETGVRTLNIIEHSEGRKIAVLNEMGELKDPESEHRKIGEIIANLKIDYLISIGPLQKFTAESAINSGMDKSKVQHVNNVLDAAKILEDYIEKGDLIYLKGSLLRHSERILIFLSGEKVGCNVTLCPFYNLCYNCKYLKKGYQNVKNS